MSVLRVLKRDPKILLARKATLNARKVRSTEGVKMSMWLTSLMLFVFSISTSAGEVSVFSVNKTLSMGPKDPIYKDYYLNGGTEEGFRRGMTVTVVRRIPVHDLSRNRALGDLRVPIAKVKLIYVNRTISVARTEKVLSSANLPASEFPTVMVGDTIVLGDGLDDISRMGDGEGESENKSEGEGPAPAPSDKSAEAEPAKAELKPSVAAVQPAPVESAAQAAPKPLPVQTLPEKNAEKPDLETRQPSSEKLKKSSAKAAEEGKNPLKSKAKPDSPSEHVVVGPTA